MQIHLLQNRPLTRRTLLKAYVSVFADATRMTVTASKATAPLLMQQISASGHVVKPIALEGRFHTSRNEEALASILSL